jgi:hypothetical protein
MSKKREEDGQLKECCGKFGRNTGKLLYRAMKRLAWLGFKVSPTDAYDRVLVADPQSQSRGYFDLRGGCLEYVVVGDSILHVPDVSASQFRRYMTE